ncbi:MAG: RsmG family class I SAM-dependent methyltransferase [Trueperaceae bacterium]
MPSADEPSADGPSAEDKDGEGGDGRGGDGRGGDGHHADGEGADGERVIAAYVALVRAYHATLDLVSERGLEAFDRHVADARVYARTIRGLAGPAPTVVDVGSGVGLPGIVIAALLPDARVVLVERRRRRTAFLELAVGKLGLARTEVFGGDVRELAGVCADVITAQAVAGLADLVHLTRHLHADPCYLVSRRGPDWRREVPGVWVALGAGRGEDATPAVGRPARAEVVVEPLEHRGSLVALRLPGGSACPSSG